MSDADRRLTRYQALTIAAALTTLALIAVGALVRTTGSGLGCPDWPLCHGRLLPPLEREPIIEYSHRSLASLVGLLIVLVAAITLRRRWSDHLARWLAIASLPLLAVQAWLGKVAVERELPAEVVTFHLATALVLFAVMALLAVLTVLGPRRRAPRSAERARLLRAVTIATGVIAIVLLLGSYLVGADAGFACTDWPGCAEARVPFIDGGRLQDIHWLHRLSVVAGLIAVGMVALEAANFPEQERWLRRGVWTAVALYVVQIGVGALNIFTDFSAGARVAHLAVGAAIWGLLVTIAVAGRCERDPQARPVAAPARPPARERGSVRT